MDTKMHNKRGMQNGCIGIVLYWRLKDSYQFMNFEKNVMEPFNMSNFDEMSPKAFSREYNKRIKSYPTISSDGTTMKSGMWSNDFCRHLASMKSRFATYTELVENDMPTTMPVDKDIVFKHELGLESTYCLMCNRMFDETVEEDEILMTVSKYHTLPEDWRLKYMKSEEYDLKYRHIR